MTVHLPAAPSDERRPAPTEPQLSEPQLSEPQLSEPQLSESQPSEPEARRDEARTLPGPTDGVPGTAPLQRAVGLVGGIAMLLTPALMIGGIVTSPPQASRATGDYIESLARDPGLTSASASLLHYGWVATAIGLLLAISLLRGRKGRLLTGLGAFVGSFAAIQMSALMLNDYFLAALGRNLALPDAVRVAEAVMVHGDLAVTVWWRCATVAVVAPVLLYLGLARAGVISWWVAPLSLFPMVAPYLVMGLVGDAADQLVGGNTLGLLAGAAVGLVCYLPTVLVGLRLLGRSRLAR